MCVVVSFNGFVKKELTEALQLHRHNISFIHSVNRFSSFCTNGTHIKCSSTFICASIFFCVPSSLMFRAIQMKFRFNDSLCLISFHSFELDNEIRVMMLKNPVWLYVLRAFICNESISSCSSGKRFI